MENKEYIINNEEEVSITDVIYDYLRYWKWFLLSMVICLIIGTMYIFVAQKDYKTSLSILLNEDNGKGSGGNSLSDLNLEAFGLLSSTNNLDNEVVVLSSPDLMRLVVDTLNLQTSYSVTERLQKIEIFKASPFHVIANNTTNAPAGRIFFDIEKEENDFKISGKYEIPGTRDKKPFETNVSVFPADVEVTEGIALHIETTGRAISEGKKYEIEVRSTYSTVSALCDNLSVAPTSKSSSVLTLELAGHSTEKNAAILKELVKQYNALNVNVKNEIAYNTSLFINERLKEISSELGTAENSLVSYKQEHNIADLNTEASLFVKQTGENEQKLLEIETQLNVISYIEQFVNDANNQFAVIPNIGITDVGLTQIISAYNTKLLASENQLRGMGMENPARIKIAEEIENTRHSISNALKSVKHTFNVTKAELQRQSNQNKARVLSVPKQEMGLLGKVREQEIKQNLFLFLMQKREETNLTIASTPSKARIVVSPQVESAAPIAPKRNIILLAAFIIGLLIPFAVIYLRKLLNTNIQNRNELEKLTNVSIVGQIARKSQEDGNIVVADGKTNPLAEMFRTLRNNLNFVLLNNDSQVIVVTSTTKGEGKTFISANLALTYALSGKKVLLVGGDIRNPQLRKYFETQKSRGLSNYLSDVTSWKEFVKPTELHPSLFLMVAGTIPPNPNELLMSPRLQQFLEEAKKEYDIIIADTAPVGLVSDTYLVDKYADVTLYIVREEVTPRDAVNYINTQKQEGKLKNMYIVLNDTNLDSPHYKYKYGYGREYGYKLKK